MTMEKSFDGRASFVRAMDEIARSVNDEDILDIWLMGGVADGAIQNDTTNAEIFADGWCDDKTMEQLMDCFMRCMKAAYKSGGLYCDGVCGGEKS